MPQPDIVLLEPTRAHLKWEHPQEPENLNLDENGIIYLVLLTDKTKGISYKTLKVGPTTSTCLVQDLTPGQEYSLRLMVSG